MQEVERLEEEVCKNLKGQKKSEFKKKKKKKKKTLGVNSANYKVRGADVEMRNTGNEK